MLPKDPEEYKTAKKIYAELCEKAVKLGGTISAEHGIGKLKRNYLLKMFGEERIQQMAAIKRQLDPNKILGIGNIFDPKYL
jgi:D-lactate dehydrogenase (cytochrome)